jgi:hypothetical protein
MVNNLTFEVKVFTIPNVKTIILNQFCNTIPDANELRLILLELETVL